MAKKDKKVYLCESCGNDFPTWSGRCAICGDWNTLKEVSFSEPSSKIAPDAIEKSKISEIKVGNFGRIKTNISEFDRVLGGGIVQGSIILLGGEPGIGKSTLILDVADKVSNCLYLSAEESLEQIKLRADRLSLKSKNITLYSGGDLHAFEREVKVSKPELVIIDSIQTVFLNDLPSTPGSLVQVRECGIFLQRLAKKTKIPVVLIGHVTKEGSIAGPRILEHLVDVVLYLEGERFHDARVLRGIKNRFGATNEAGIFKMSEKGMEPIDNPSELFLRQRPENAAGSAVAVTLEGTRPILVEVQALTTATSFGYPKRTSSGFDLNRLNLLAAVITKSTKINLSNQDIYLNIVGGLKLREPAVDLAVCAAIISSYLGKPIQKELSFFGEIGLMGEIRPVVKQVDRENDAKKLGFKNLSDIKKLSELLSKMF